METAVFLGFNALGDTLCTTPALRGFRRRHPGRRIVYVVQNAPFCRVLDGNPDVDLVLYSESLYLGGPDVATSEWIAGLPLALEGPANLYRFDHRFICTSEAAFREHISVGFAKALGIAIDSIRPVVALDERDRKAAGLFQKRPYVVFSMHSLSNPPHPDGQGGRKDWPLERWAALAEIVQGKGFEVLALGSERDPRPALPPGVRMLYGLPIRVVAALIEGVACFVTVENGLAHLAAAFDVPTVELYSDVVPVEWARPAESTRCTLLYGDPRAVTLEEVAALVEQRLELARACA